MSDEPVLIYEICQVANGFIVYPRPRFDSTISFEEQYVFGNLKEVAQHLAAQWGIPSIEHRLFKNSAAEVEYTPVPDERIYKTMPSPLPNCRAPGGRCADWHECITHNRCCFIDETA